MCKHGNQTSSKKMCNATEVAILFGCREAFAQRSPYTDSPGTWLIPMELVQPWTSISETQCALHRPAPSKAINSVGSDWPWAPVFATVSGGESEWERPTGCLIPPGRRQPAPRCASLAGLHLRPRFRHSLFGGVCRPFSSVPTRATVLGGAGTPL